MGILWSTQQSFGCGSCGSTVPSYQEMIMRKATPGGSPGMAVLAPVPHSEVVCRPDSVARVGICERAGSSAGSGGPAGAGVRPDRQREGRSRRCDGCVASAAGAPVGGDGGPGAPGTGSYSIRTRCDRGWPSGRGRRLRRRTSEECGAGWSPSPARRSKCAF